ncbi:hypothetical protein ACFL2J_00805 [Candidatus Omnitrophota bacterium]
MNNKGKVAVFFVILLLILSLGATGFYYISFEKERRMRVELEGQLSSAQDDKKAIEIELNEISEEKASLETKIEENKGFISKLNDKLAAEIKTKELLKHEQGGLLKKITEITEGKRSMQEVLDEKLQEITALQNKLDAAISEKTGLSQESEDLSFLKEDAVDLERIVVAPTISEAPRQGIGQEVENEVVEVDEEPGEMPEETPRIELEKEAKRPAISCEVMLINREYNFLVLSVGEVDGVKEGDVFEIYRADTSLGQVRIEKVHERMSAANFLPDLFIAQVSEGDKAERLD